MYYRKGRLSFLVSKEVIWLRIRNKEMKAKGFLFRIGREY